MKPINSILINSIINEYGFTNEKLVDFFHYGKNNKVLLIGYKGESFLLKKHTMLKPHAVNTLEQLFDKFQTNKITTPMIKTKNDRFILSFDNNYYSMLKYIEVNKISTNNELKKVAQKIAKMHRLMAMIDHKTLKSPLYVSPEKRIFLLNKYNLSFLISIITKNIIDSIHYQLVHNDLHIGNIISTSSNDIYIIDFDCFSYNSLISDITFAAFRFTGGFQTSFFDFIRYYDQVSPIRNEIQYGYILLLKDFVKKLCFILKEYEIGNFSYYKKDYKKYLAFIRETIKMTEKGKLTF